MNGAALLLLLPALLAGRARELLAAKNLGRIIWDWLVIVAAAALIALVWLGPPPGRVQETIWLAALISASFQLQCYRRWLRNAHQWLDESHERERWYRERLTWLSERLQRKSGWIS